MSYLKKFVRITLVSAAISGVGIGCDVDTQEALNQDQLAQKNSVETVADAPVYRTMTSEHGKTTKQTLLMEVVGDKTLRFSLNESGLSFEMQKGWTVTSSTPYHVRFHRSNEHGVSDMVVSVQVASQVNSQEFIKHYYPNAGGLYANPYKDVMQGTDGYYLQSDGGAGSNGVFAEMFGDTLATVVFFTNSEGSDELGFNEAIASLYVVGMN